MYGGNIKFHVLGELYRVYILNLMQELSTCIYRSFAQTLIYTSMFKDKKISIRNCKFFQTICIFDSFERCGSEGRIKKSTFDKNTFENCSYCIFQSALYHFLCVLKKIKGQTQYEKNACRLFKGSRFERGEEKKIPFII